MSKEAWQECSDEDLMESDPEFQKQLDDEEHCWAEAMEADLLKMIKGSKDG